MKSAIVFIICWVGLASVVDYFDISGPWAMLFGILALCMHDWIMYALRGGKHERA